MLWTPRAPGQALEGEEVSGLSPPRAGDTGAGKVLVDKAKEQGKETWPTREK
jgi:hypothetical protein